VSSQKNYDVIVIGAGHAGCEGRACLGAHGMLHAHAYDEPRQHRAHVPATRPSGGLPRANLVKEIDALGGEMAKIIDRTGIQFRILNRSKGPAVRGTRGQADKQRYRMAMKESLEKQQGLDVKQGLVEKLLVANGTIFGVETNIGVQYLSSTAIITTGTFLKGLVHIGLSHYPSEGQGSSLRSDFRTTFGSLVSSWVD